MGGEGVGSGGKGEGSGGWGPPVHPHTRGGVAGGGGGRGGGRPVKSHAFIRKYAFSHAHTRDH